MMWSMAYGAGEVTSELSEALALVRGSAPQQPDAVVVLAWFVDSLAKEYGLSDSLELDSGRLERIHVPEAAAGLVNYYLGDGEERLDEDHLRDRLYMVFVELSESPEARNLLNRNQPLSEVGLLYLAQIYWNLEGSDARPRLPIRGGTINHAGRLLKAEIPVPGANKDFATMKWAARANEPGQYKSSGQGFRNQGARLAVLAARLIVAGNPEPPPSLGGATLKLGERRGGGQRVQAIVWPDSAGVVEEPNRTQHAKSHGTTILVGRPIEVGAGYQRRGFDDEIDGWWAGGGERRVWLSGGPGLGKSFSAGRVVRDALSHNGSDREALVVWVNDAQPDTVRGAFGEAADRLHERGWLVYGALDSTSAKADPLFQTLATSPWQWLIVLDNADPGALIQAGLVPPGQNPNGRVLVTTLVHEPRMSGHGRVILAELFTAGEADSYLRSQPSLPGRGPGPFRDAPVTDTVALASAVGHHPLALAIATSTIVANALTIGEWISDFAAAADMDAAADEPDPGGYARTLGATWRVGMERASVGLPEGAVARAALVAALQDPDGHPTWVWDVDEISGWVTGMPLAHRRGGMPTVVRRLVDHGLLRLNGAEWKTGRLVIHQLAARAVRESADHDTMVELAGLLADQWLLHLTTPGARSRTQTRELRSNVQPMLLIQGLPPGTENAVVALSGYGDVADPQGLSLAEETLALVEPYLLRGGVTGRVFLLDELHDVGNQLAEVGRLAEAQSTYDRAAHLCRELLEDAALPERTHAELLTTLGAIEGKLGQPPEKSRARYETAAKLYERLIRTAQDGDDLDLCVALSGLYETLGAPDRQRAIQTRVDELLAHSSQDDATNDAPAASESGFDSWRLGRQLHQLGRLPAAATHLVRAADAFEQGEGIGNGFRQRKVLRDLLDVHLDAERWAKAEAILSRGRGVHDPLLLASVQQRLGRVTERDANLRLAAEAHQLRREVPQGADAPGQTREARAKGLGELAVAYLDHLGEKAVRMSRWDDAVSLHESRLTLLGQFAEPGNLYDERDTAESYWILGMAYGHTERHEEAIEHARRAVTILETLSQLNSEDDDGRRSLAFAQFSLGRALAWGEHHEEAIRPLTQAIDALEERTDSDDMLAEVYARLGGVYLHLDRPDDAHDPLARVVELRKSAARCTPHNRTLQANLAAAQAAAGLAELKRGCADEAAGLLTESVDALQRLVDLDPLHEPTQIQLAESLVVLGSAHEMGDRPVEAADCLRRAVDAMQIFAELAPRQRGPFYLACLRGLVELLRRLARDTEAAHASRRSEEFANRYPESNA